MKRHRKKQETIRVDSSWQYHLIITNMEISMDAKKEVDEFIKECLSDTEELDMQSMAFKICLILKKYGVYPIHVKAINVNWPEKHRFILVIYNSNESQLYNFRL